MQLVRCKVFCSTNRMQLTIGQTNLYILVIKKKILLHLNTN